MCKCPPLKCIKPWLNWRSLEKIQWKRGENLIHTHIPMCQTAQYEELSFINTLFISTSKKKILLHPRIPLQIIYCANKKKEEEEEALSLYHVQKQPQHLWTQRHLGWCQKNQCMITEKVATMCSETNKQAHKKIKIQIQSVTYQRSKKQNKTRAVRLCQSLSQRWVTLISMLSLKLHISTTMLFKQQQTFSDSGFAELSTLEFLHSNT